LADGCTTSITGTVAARPIGAKSFAKSNVRFGVIAALTTFATVPRNSVYPSFGARRGLCGDARRRAGAVLDHDLLANGLR
jgi:hypothetical protein